MLISATTLLNHIGETRHDAECGKVGQRIKAAYNAALGGDLGTKEFARAVTDRLGA